MKAQPAARIFHVSNLDTAMNKCIVFAVATLLLLNSGCTIHRSEETRTNSFRPHIGQRIDQVEVQSFLSSRVALLLAGDQLPAFPTNDFTISPGKDFEAQFGCATAIDRRGYFLTAAHLTKKDTIYLILKSDAAKDAERARVVWRGEPSKGQPDLAILYVPQPLDHVFEWMTNCYVGEPVMAVGLSRAKTNCLGPEFLGGKILQFSQRKGKPLHNDVIHNVPEQGGDTGGPLVTSDGRLIGINFGGELRVHLIFLVLPAWWNYSYFAVLPDLQWLSEIIEKDAATSSIEPAGQSHQ